MKSIRLGLAMACLSLLLPAAAQAQEMGAGDAENRWQFTIAPYLLAPSMDGQVTVRGIDAEVEASPGDIFSNLRFGFMVYAEARRGDWAFSIDALYMDLAQDAERLPLRVGMDQGAYMFSVYRTVAPWADVYIGGRINVLGSSLKGTAGPGRIDVDESETWFDPYIGMRLSVPDTGRWHLGLRFDVGGGVVGSKFAWHLQPIVAYEASRLVRFAAAYRWLGMDYTASGPPGSFRYDVVTSGPELGVAFSF